MAKLSARGRIELLRISKEENVINDELIKWKRYTRVYMSDGNVLSKYDVRFIADERFHSYGWKRNGKMIDGLTIHDIAQRHEASGWKIERI